MGTTVLLVDDDAKVATVTAEYLQRELTDATVHVEECPTRALELLDADPPDCVVSDYDMPEMDGLELLDSVRDRYPDLPFVLYTGKGSEEIASEAIRRGVTEYLQKETGTGQYDVLANRVETVVEWYRGKRRTEKQAERLTALLDTLPVVLFVFDSEGTFTLSRGRGLSAIGLDPGDVEGESVFDVYGDRQDITAQANRALDGERVHAVNDVAGHRFETWYQPVTDESGDVERVVGVAADVTDLESED